MVLKTTQLGIVYCLAENTPVQLTKRFQFHVIVVSLWIGGIRDVIQLIVEEFSGTKVKSYGIILISFKFTKSKIVYNSK